MSLKDLKEQSRSLENVIFNLVLLIGIFKSSDDNVFRWLPQNLTDEKSILVQVMAWCRQATSHYLNQCWPRSPTPYGVTMPQWVKGSLKSSDNKVVMMPMLLSVVALEVVIMTMFSNTTDDFPLAHWGQMMHICNSKLTIIGSDNGLLPDWHQAIIWTNAGILLIGPLGTNFSEIVIEIYTFSFKKMHLKMLSGKWHPFCLSLNVSSLLLSSTSDPNTTIDSHFNTDQ